MKSHDDVGGGADLNVPLSSRSLPARREEAAAVRSRLSRGGVAAAAFAHTAYGRLDPARDDADAALPWDVLLGVGGDGAGGGREGVPKKKKRRRGEDGGGGATFGRTSDGLRVYRRLNVVLEEAADASRLLASADHRRLLGKYDLVSLQPMNEPSMRCVCELLSPGPGGNAAAEGGDGGGNADLVDVVTVEYATGPRGGSGPPYRLRGEYLAGALAAGTTFEVNYAAAVLDPRRRQGFVRTLGDFASALGRVQGRHALLNGGGRKRGREGRSDGFPLLLSSGPRRNYTRGTDEGVEMSLRSHDDVRFMVRHLVGGTLGPTEGKGRTCAAGRVLARAGDRRAGLAGDGRPGGVRARRLVRDGGDGPGEGSDDENSDDDDEILDGDIVAWLSRAPTKGRGAPTGDRSDGDDAAADHEELLAHLRSGRGEGGGGGSTGGDGDPPVAEDEDEGKSGGEGDPVERATAKDGGGRGDANEELGDGFIAF